ncbi:MAG: hypothetical protein EBR09_05075 [Proteobacteria bacterium]|nr:hypothetical protein [Pseudomonadota bacterium]
MRSSFAAILVALPFVVSCATIRVVTTKPRNGGVIAIQPGLWGQEEARAKAEATMSANCRGKYEITEEGETVIGTTSSTQGNSDQKYNKKGSSTATSSTTDTTNKTEHRITYACTK